MEEIKTKIDEIFEFVQTRKKTTVKEVSKQLGLNAEELEKYIHVLRKYGLIRVRYDWFNTHLYAEEDPVKLAAEFKSQLYTENTAEVLESDSEVTDRNLKIMALRSMLVE